MTNEYNYNAITYINYHSKVNYLPIFEQQNESALESIKMYKEKSKILRDDPIKNVQQLIIYKSFIESCDQQLKNNNELIDTLKKQIRNFELAFLKENF